MPKTIHIKYTFFLWLHLHFASGTFLQEQTCEIFSNRQKGSKETLSHWCSEVLGPLSVEIKHMYINIYTQYRSLFYLIYISLHSLHYIRRISLSIALFTTFLNK